MLELLSENLKLCNFVVVNNPILQATIPVLKIRADPKIPYEDFQNFETSVELEFDIVVDNGYMNFLSSQHRTTEFIKECKHTYPTFTSVILLLKFILS